MMVIRKEGRSAECSITVNRAILKSVDQLKYCEAALTEDGLFTLSANVRGPGSRCSAWLLSLPANPVAVVFISSRDRF